MTSTKADDLRIKSKHLDEADDHVASVEVEMFPLTTTEEGLLSKWEELVGIIPDPSSSVEQRREDVVIALRASGGISVRYFKELSASFGYNYGETAPTPRIWFEENTDFTAFRTDLSKIGDALLDPTLDDHKHLVEIHGTNVEENTALRQLFERLVAFGVTLVFINE